jgi:hypothetical protein
MRNTRVLSFAVLAIPAAVLLACSDSTSPEPASTRAPAAFRAVALRAGAPALSQRTVSFWARYDQDREVALYFRPQAGSTDSTEYLRFKVPSRSILRDAAGRTFSGTDSVLITITVPDSGVFAAQFEPSGLRFDPARPAKLKFKLAERDDDLDRDGDDTDDDDRLQNLSLWRQERPGSVWERIASLVVESLEEIEAELTGFTGYAVAI